MDAIQGLINLFFYSVTTVVQSAPYICMFIVAAFLSAVIFGMIDMFLSRR